MKLKTFCSKFLLVVGLLLPMVFWAQDVKPRFGIKAGVNKTYFNVDQNDLGAFATSETGYYGGMFVGIPIDDFLTIQPEAMFISLGDFNFLNVPIYAKYEVVDDLYLLAGPSMNYFFDFIINKFKVAADISSSYQISSNIDVHIKYTLGLNELAPNGLFFGLGFKL